MAEPKITEKIKHYTASGTTVDAIRNSMNKNGPNGFWGFTEWYVRWSGSCKVSVTVDYTMPKLDTSQNIPRDVKAKFDVFYAKLLKHEKNHGLHGITAAREIEADKCKNSHAIIKKFNRKDLDYDKRTRHGRSEGIRF